MTTRRTPLRATLALAALTALAATGTAPARAQTADFPTKGVRITTPFPVGSGPETVLRVLADKLQKKWGKPVIVENKPGANGFIAIEQFRRNASDPHELVQLDNVHLVAYPHLFRKLPYDAAKDFDVLAPLFRTYFFVAVPSTSAYRSVGDIVADAKARPGALNYGSWSVGNPVHLGSALLESATGTQMQHVIYKETSMLYAAVGNGELDFALGSLATAGPMQRSGKVRFIATTSPSRQAAFPDVPTVAESGGPAGFELTGWTAVAVGRGVPKAIADRIRRDVEAALAEPDFKERYATLGYEPFPTTPERFAGFIAGESTKYADVVRRAKIALD
ncbi:MAG: tripartite tricarboxylate transporter substrate binding protein [Burkholderiales bacterium]|jgi:tripartite-type tricarboxylate transporter receptor subunit TctC